MTTYDDWADLYDILYAWRSEDIPFYVDEALRCGGPVLELGCGTGRVTLPLAQAGVDVTGLDSSAGMLRVARRKAKAAGIAAGSVTWTKRDMLTFSLGRRFSLVILPFNSFLDLLTVQEQKACLERVKAHLAPGGRLVFDIFVPDMENLTEASGALVHAWDTTVPETGGRMVVWDQSGFDNHNQLINARLVLDQVTQTGEVERRLYREFQIRYMHRFEAQHLLEACGFRILDLFGDFARGPFDEDSAEMVWVAEQGN